MSHVDIFSKSKSSLSSFYVPVVAITGRNTRLADTMCMKVPQTRTKLGQHASSHRGPKFWNSILKELKLVKNLTTFKHLV